MLRKPFDRDAVADLIERLAPETTTSSGGTPDVTGHEPDPREWGAR
jgi:hypothetical protein